MSLKVTLHDIMECKYADPVVKSGVTARMARHT